MSGTHAHSVAYVRDTMLPPQDAPSTQSGAVKWLRDNLFSGAVNTVLTVLGALVIAWMVLHFYPWFLHSVWNANSLAECREIIAARWGEGQTGACWAVIRERWSQYIFGFYPWDLIWRPIAVFLLLFVAIAPVLFTQLPRQMLWFSVIYPALAIYMLWGGSIWGPFVALAGVAAGVLAYRLLSPLTGGIVGTILGAGVAVAWWMLITTKLTAAFDQGVLVWTLLSLLWGAYMGRVVWRYLAKTTEPLFAAVVGLSVAFAWAGAVTPDLAHHADTAFVSLGSTGGIGLQPVSSDKFGGFLLAVTIGVGGIALSLPLGIMLALGRKSDMFLIRSFSIGFIEFIRGVPLITLLFVASLLLSYFLPPQANFDIILRVEILVTLFAAAYIAEVIRGGLAALPRGQYEAADALGLDYWQAQRLIILPQALKISIPGIVSTFIGMFKDTTLVVFVGLFDPLKGISDFVRADFDWKGIYWEPYLFVGAIFFIFNFSMSRYSMYLERKLKRDHR